VGLDQNTDIFPVFNSQIGPIN